jgi:hypothetical protein
MKMPTSHIMAVFFTVLALTMGLPTRDAESDAFDMASHEVTVLLQQGKDDSACADLAKSLIDEVTDKVDSANKLIATLDDGSDCSSKGQDAVAAATTNKENAEKAATEAASAASSATDTEVDFGSYSLNSLTEGTCAQFWSDPSYTAAKKTAAEATTAQTEADAKAKAAEAPLQAAKEQAAKDVKACQCAVRAEYNLAYSAATEGVEADAAAYTKGKNMQCVLAGTAAADCKVGDVPKLKEITLAEGVPAEVCTTPSPTSSPTPSPTGSPTRAPTPKYWAVTAGNSGQVWKEGNNLESGCPRYCTGPGTAFPDINGCCLGRVKTHKKCIEAAKILSPNLGLVVLSRTTTFDFDPGRKCGEMPMYCFYHAPYTYWNGVETESQCYGGDQKEYTAWYNRATRSPWDGVEPAQNSRGDSTTNYYNICENE